MTTSTDLDVATIGYVKATLARLDTLMKSPKETAMEETAVQDYIDIDEHAESSLYDLAEVMADFPTHANCEQLTIILARRLAAVEEAQDFTANRLGELVAHEHMEAENRLAAVEEAQDTIGKQLVNLACHKQTALDTKALLDSMQRQLDQTEARLARYAMRLAESDVNLQDCMDRIVAMEKKLRTAAWVEAANIDAVWQAAR
jgi:hypothetical protein